MTSPDKLHLLLDMSDASVFPSSRSHQTPVYHRLVLGRRCTGRRLGHLLFFLIRRRKCITDEAIDRALDSILIVPSFRLQEPSVNECVNFR